MESDPLWALLWRILTWCTRHRWLRTRHIHSRPNVIADKLSRLGQTIQQNGPSIQRYSSNMLPVAASSSGPVCHQVRQLHLCLTSSRSPSLGSRCLQSTLGGPGPICLPTSSYLGQSGGKVTGPAVQQLILIAPGWSNMPWFWDLVTMSSQIPLCALSAWLLTQLLNQTLHRNLVNLNLHAWPLGPQLPRKQGFPEAVAARIEAPPEDQQISLWGKCTICFTRGTSVIRWTSGHHFLKAIADFPLYLFKTGSYSRAPLMTIDQPLLTIWEFAH